MEPGGGQLPLPSGFLVDGVQQAQGFLLQAEADGKVRQGGRDMSDKEGGKYRSRHGLPFFYDLLPRYCFSFTKKVFEGCLTDPGFS